MKITSDKDFFLILKDHISKLNESDLRELLNEYDNKYCKSLTPSYEKPSPLLDSILFLFFEKICDNEKNISYYDFTSVEDIILLVKNVVLTRFKEGKI